MHSRLQSLLRPRTLTGALNATLALVIVPLLLGALALLASQALQEEKHTTEHLATLAATLVEAVDRELDKGTAQLEVLAASSSIDRGDMAGLYAHAARVVADRPGVLVALVRPDGQQVFNTFTPFGSPQPNLWQIADSQQEVVWEGRRLPYSTQYQTRQVFERGVTIYSDLYYGFTVRRPALSLSVPVKRDETVAYALTLSFPPALLENLIRSGSAGPQARIAVIDRRGLVVASNSATVLKLGDRATPIQMREGASSGTYEGVSRDGTALRGGYAVSSKNGFVVRVSLPRNLPLLSSGRSTTAGWLLLVIVALGVSLGLARWMGGRISAPLRQLALAYREGRTPAADSATGIEEIDALAQALRDAARAEEERTAAMVQSAQRAEAEQALRRADRQKDEFLATLAHELRNPLAPIRTSVEILRRSGSDEPVVARAQDVIARQLDHLTRLVDDLLDVSRITLGSIQLRLERVDLREVAADAVEAVGPAMALAGLTLQEPPPGPPLVVKGDRTRLVQCLVNLLANATKFTPRGGEVQLALSSAGGRGMVEVRDTGMGIAPQALERIFELFAQEHLSGSQGNTGLGVGLALTRKLLALHGGRVTAESAGQGQGACFRIELPLAPVQLASVSPAAAPRAASLQPAAQGRLLVVDDNVDAANSLGELMGMSGFECTVVHTGEAAVEAAQAGNFDIILLDIGLPGIDGYEACMRIRSALGRRPLVVALTGWGQDEDRRAADSAGFDAHVTKPADPHRLMDLLSSLMAARVAAEGAAERPGAQASPAGVA